MVYQMNCFSFLKIQVFFHFFNLFILLFSCLTFSPACLDGRMTTNWVVLLGSKERWGGVWLTTPRVYLYSLSLIKSRDFHYQRILLLTQSNVSINTWYRHVTGFSSRDSVMGQNTVQKTRNAKWQR